MLKVRRERNEAHYYIGGGRTFIELEELVGKTNENEMIM